MGKLRSKVRASEVDGSSMADLAFLLLIFFIVTSTFVLSRGLFLSLPSEDAKTIKKKDLQSFDVFPLKEGYELSGKKMSKASIIKKLKSAQKKTDDVLLVIKMRKNIAYGRMVECLGIAKELGVKVSLKNAF